MFTIETRRLGFIPMTKEALEAAIIGGHLALKIAGALSEPIHKERVFPIVETHCSLQSYEI